MHSLIVVLVIAAVAVFVLLKYGSSVDYFTSSPKTVMIVRHCDKPSNSHDPNCSSIGYQRAQQLVDKVLPRLNFVPDALFAAATKSNKGGKACTRAIRTDEMLQPTSKKYDLSIQQPFCIRESKELGQEIQRSSSSHVLVAWEHDQIADLIDELVGGSFPKWPHDARDRFDLVFTVDMAAKKIHVGTMQLSLSPHDSDKVPPEYSKYT